MALIDKASLLMVPSTYEAGKLYNVLPSGNRAPDSTDKNSGYDNTRADFDFDRGSNAAATRIGSDGLLKKYRENLLTESNNFSDSDWFNTNATVTSGQSGYDGASDAWKLEAATTSATLLQQSEDVSSDTPTTVSIYAKSGNVDFLKMLIVCSGPNSVVIFDLSDGSTSGSSRNISVNTEDVGGGWFRCSTTAAPGTNITSVRFELRSTLGSGSADEGSYIFIQNAQAESGLVATDYLNSTDVTAKSGVLIDLPRINYDANGENGALLLEPSRQQLLPFSEYFGAWAVASGGTGSNPIITSNYATSPDGNLNAARIQFNRGSGTGGGDTSYITYGLSAGTIDATLSVYLKTNDGSTKDVTLRLGTSLFDFNVSVTSEWKRFTLSGNTNVDRMQILLYGNENNQTADLSCFAAQVEAGSYATSYIPNHGESGGVTRAADSCSVTGASDVIGQTEGTLFAQVGEFPKENNGRILGISDGTSSNYVIIIKNSANTDFAVYATNGGTAQATYLGTSSLNNNSKIAVGYANNDYVVYVNGNQVHSDTSASVPTCSNIYIGQRENGSVTYLAGGSVKQALLFKERLTNAELATLTTL